MTGTRLRRITSWFARAAVPRGSVTVVSPEVRAGDLGLGGDVSRHVKPFLPEPRDDVRRAAFVMCQEVRHLERIFTSPMWREAMYQSTVDDILDAADRLGDMAIQIRRRNEGA